MRKQYTIWVYETYANCITVEADSLKAAEAFANQRALNGGLEIRPVGDKSYAIYGDNPNRALRRQYAGRE